jgi:hypothetical protein
MSTLSFSSEINTELYTQMVYLHALEENTEICPQQALLPIQMGLTFELLGQGWEQTIL